MTLTTTLALLRQHGACYLLPDHDPAPLLAVVGDRGEDDPIPLADGIGRLPLDDVLWALRAVPPEQAAARDRLARLFACDCAERALPIWERWAPDDRRPHEVIAVARRYATGEATEQELAAARAAARDAVGDATWAAAMVAAMVAAGDAERAWQAERLRVMLESEPAAGEVTP